ncbi:MAG: tRNA uridine-5-carboxymethylaminomethyl(34) synthesis GTPase MnmE [Blastocatellia bacterium]|nr:tRNA uridine-5-carboxymethylaminomethyl(34) synthesis GTPase MnmE [Blastocatellia bacterium]
MTMFFFDDTIAAISTPSGRGGIGVIRISGTNSAKILSQLAPKADLSAIQKAQLVEIQDSKSVFIDQAIAIYFQAPKSYTGQDVVEISCHGSPFILSRLLQLCFSLGARAASPGEFTMRAFLSGRMDLTQAEAVRDLIDSQTEYQARLAARQLKGELSNYLQPVKSELLEIIVHLESAVEFVEENLNTDSIASLTTRLNTLVAKLHRLAKSYQFGRVVRSGVNLAIVGRPNVGKSSLFNVLLQKDRAIVTDVPGTTRDSLIEQVSLGGIPIYLIDTAGIRKTTDVVEKMGIERSYSAMIDADLVLQVVDGSTELNQDDKELLFNCSNNPVPFAVIINKSDLGEKISPQQIIELVGNKISEEKIFSVSAKTCQGIDNLQRDLVNKFFHHDILNQEDTLILDARHFALLSNTISQLSDAINRFNEGFSEEVALCHLHLALNKLGEITGETTIEDILGQIFATFCVGK